MQLASTPRDAADAGVIGDKRANPRRMFVGTATKRFVDGTRAPRDLFMTWLRIGTDNSVWSARLSSPCVNRLSMPILSGNRPLTEPRDTAATAAKPISGAAGLLSSTCPAPPRRARSRRSDRHLCRAISAAAAVQWVTAAPGLAWWRVLLLAARLRSAARGRTTSPASANPRNSKAAA
jgi:hypothetical protein